MALLLDFSTNSLLSRGVAGPVAIAAKDGILEDQLGQLYPMQYVDTAATSSGAVVAKTTLAAEPISVTRKDGRNPQIQHSVTGDMYYAYESGANVGLSVAHYSLGNVLLGTLVIAAAGSLNDPQIFEMSDHNIMVIYRDDTNNLTKFVIFDVNLNIVVAITALADPTTSNSSTAGVCILPGQFAICYVNTTTPAVRFVIYNNAGTVAVGPTTLVALSGSVGFVFCRAGVLDTGNIVFAFASNYTGVANSQYAIYTPLGVVVKALTVFGGWQFWLELCIGTGGFMLGGCSATTTLSMAVFNDVGVQQGATRSFVVSAQAIAYPQIKLLWDSVNVRYLAVYMKLGTVGVFVDALSVVGAATVLTSNITNTNTSASAVEAILDRLRLIIISAASTPLNTGAPWRLAVYALATGIIETDTSTIPGSTPNGDAFSSLVATGDFSYSLLAGNSNDPTCAFIVNKYRTTSVQGVAFTSFAANAVQWYRSSVGSWDINKLKGGIAHTFNHTGAVPPGRQGTLSQNSVTFTA